MKMENFNSYLEQDNIFLFRIQNTFSNHMELRNQLRNGVYSFLHKEGAELDKIKHVLDLDLVPKTKDFGISISHCKNQGVFVVSPKYLNIGVDIEESHRIQKDPLLRVSSEKEIQEAPDLAHLWTAKESAFKSFLKVSGPKVLSEINIYDWENLTSNIFLFKFNLKDSNQIDLKGTGFSWKEDCLNLSISKI
jgi:phosphopantetheinyl transferase (holo-ACP synthase)